MNAATTSMMAMGLVSDNRAEREGHEERAAIIIRELYVRQVSDFSFKLTRKSKQSSVSRPAVRTSCLTLTNAHNQCVSRDVLAITGAVAQGSTWSWDVMAC